MADARAAPKLARDTRGERHEPSPVDLRAIAAAMALAAGGIAIAATVPWLVISRSAAPARAPNDASKPAIARHAQATAPATELAAYRLEKLRRLESDGVDPATGAAHISIEHAMEILSGPPR